MLRLLDKGPRLCDGLSRREWLYLGGLGLLGATAHGRVSTHRRVRSVIQILLLGGPPQHETWDPKPQAPIEVRGDLKPIPSVTPGLWVGELMPKTAQLTNHIAVIRSMHTGDHAHSSSGYYMTTGVPHVPKGVENAKPGAPNDWPSLGALVRHLGPRTSAFPAAITLPEVAYNDGNLTWPGQDGGFLGRAADPWLINCEPEAKTFEIPGLSLPSEIPPLRFDARHDLLAQVNRHLDAVAHATDTATHDNRTRQAIDLIRTPEARRAFDLDREPPRRRDHYGRTRFGQSLLLARRLVEVGVPFIRVNWTRVPNALNNGAWDTHQRNNDGLKQLMPILDQAYAALLSDLQHQGLLQDTLVIWMGEFGRTPKFNAAAGRDHWGNVFSIALAGGGIAGGCVHGASDKLGAYPATPPVLPEDLTATVLDALGIPPESEFQDPLGRPLVASRGRIMREWFQ
jgi:hypothetical protein